MVVDTTYDVDVQSLPLEKYIHDLAIAYVTRTAELDEDSTHEQYAKVYNDAFRKFGNLLTKRQS